MKWRELKKIEKILNREDLNFERKKLYNLQQFEIIRYFAKNIIGGKITLDNANENQSKSLTEIVEFNKYTKSRN